MTKQELKQIQNDERAAREYYESEMEYYGFSDEEIEELWDKD